MVFVSRYSEYFEAAHEESSFFYGRAKRVSLHVKTSRVEQGGVFRLARVVLSVTIATPRPLGRICRRTEPPRRGVPWPPSRGPVFEKFSIFLFLLFSFFFFRRLESLDWRGFPGCISEKKCVNVGGKVRQCRGKSASMSGEKCVIYSENIYNSPEVVYKTRAGAGKKFFKA